MFGLVGKIKLYIIIALAALMPIIHLLGRRKGRVAEQNKIIRDELDAQKKASNFYKSMAEHEDSTSNDRSSLTDRLRGNGL